MFISLCSTVLIFQLMSINEGNKHCYVHQVVFSGSDTFSICASVKAMRVAMFITLCAPALIL